MKQHLTAIEKPPQNLRAGVISSLILAIGYLTLTGISDGPRVWIFMVLFAVCFVLMMKSVVDLLIWVFGRGASYSGKGIGHSVRLLRRVV